MEKIMKTMNRPATLQLEDHAELSLNYLARMVDTREGCLPYWRVILDHKLPYAEHLRVDDSELPGSWVDAMILARQMTGSQKGKEVEESMKKLLLSSFAEDGLRYHKKYPWSPVIFTNICEQAYILNGLVAWYLESGDKTVKTKIDGLISGLRKIATQVKEHVVWHGIYPKDSKSYFFLRGNYYPKTGWDFARPSGRGESLSIWNGIILQPLIRYLEESGSPEAEDLIEGMINYILYNTRHFGHKGEFIGHFVCNVWTAIGILKYGILKGNKEFIERAKEIYDYAKSIGSSFGWFPEYSLLRAPKEEYSELCNTVHMITGAIILAKHGYGEYWEDVERFTRNHLIESQLREVDPIQVTANRKDTARTTYKDIPGRAKGSFLYTSPNDLSCEIPPYNGGRFIAGCCAVIGPRALYFVWNNAVEKRGDELYVHLQVNRDTPWLEVISLLPFQGKVQILCKDNLSLCWRVPVWAKSKVKATVAGKPVSARQHGQYLKVTHLRKGQTVKFEFPLLKEKRKDFIRGEEFTTTWRGDTVVAISPPEMKYPLYKREHMNVDKPPLIARKKGHVLSGDIQWL